MPFYADIEGSPHIRRRFVGMYVDIVQHAYDEDGNETQLIAQASPTLHRQRANDIIEGYVFNHETTDADESLHPCFLRKPKGEDENSEDENSEDENSEDDRVEVTVNLSYSYVDENDNVLAEDNSSSFFDNGAFHEFVYESFDFQDGLIASVITMTSITGVLIRIVGTKVFDGDNEVGIAFQVLELHLAMNADEDEDDDIEKIVAATRKSRRQRKRSN